MPSGDRSYSVLSNAFTRIWESVSKTIRPIPQSFAERIASVHAIASACNALATCLMKPKPDPLTDPVASLAAKPHPPEHVPAAKVKINETDHVGKV